MNVFITSRQQQQQHQQQKKKRLLASKRFKFFSAFHCTESANELRSNIIIHTTLIGKLLTLNAKETILFSKEKKKICNVRFFQDIQKEKQEKKR